MTMERNSETVTHVESPTSTRAGVEATETGTDAIHHPTGIGVHKDDAAGSGGSATRAPTVVHEAN
jgi:hypothetical protein